jgi:hypothetical protein
MTRAEFSNLLRILTSVDMDELVAVKLIDHGGRNSGTRAWRP